ncbi:HD-GYP domain-containing protein [Bacillus shivajii]|uniref:HD-GYP domain-containing protein n=1 Tax=Bacillus shivajii TaxID=1983719 RepID=UPI001CFC183A|nr:HD-GYP domain-containing protein [Bacillus shivajii]UCZ53261.1 HD-GYP domain-containing protein [Bacillus shivajii]
MKVKTIYLVPGCILAEDVHKATNNPIMRKKTVLTEELIEILHIFLIQNVKVELTLVNGERFNPKEVEELQEDDSKTSKKQTLKKEESFIDIYLKTVPKFKKIFQHWQGGTKVDVYEVRKIFLPLFEVQPTKEELMQLHHYGTKDDYIYFHSVAVGVLSYMVGKSLKLAKGELIQLGLAGLLSDCGMARVPFKVFSKRGPLSVSEYEEVRKHPLLGYKMIEATPGFSKGAILGILQHHEREDGSGYPQNLKGTKLHLFAKIIAICDTYHAMTSERHYRTKQLPYKVIEAMKKDHFGKFDHIVLNKFFSIMTDISIGNKVKLNNGEVGKVIFLEDQSFTRPVLQLNEQETLSLTKHPELFIEETIRD